MRATRAQICSLLREHAFCVFSSGTRRLARPASTAKCEIRKAHSIRLLSALAGLLLFCRPLMAAPQEMPKVDFNRDIRPILSDHCYACHGPDENKRKGGLRLDRQAEAFKTLKSGNRAIVPGDLEKSTLVKRLTSHDPDELMPPPEIGRAHV